MPKHHRAEAERRMPFRAEEIFALVADPERQPSWLPGEAEGAEVTYRVRHAAGPRRGLGARYLRLQESDGSGDLARFETTAYDEPWLVGFSDGLTFDLRPDGTHTVVHC